MIRIAVVGAGHWGPNLIRNFHDAEVSEVAVVVDSQPARAEQTKSRFPGVTVSTRVEDAFSPAVDAVVISTPTSTHFDLAKQALESGKHVLVEKPISTTTAEAEELVGIASRKELVLMVGHVFLYNAAVQRVKGYIEEGDLGKIYYVSMVRTNLGPIRMDVDAAWDLASHDISIANWWLETEPVSAAAMGGNWINDGLNDAVFATLRYPGEILVNLHVSWLNPRKARDITVVGERKMLTFDDMNLSEPLRIYDKGVTDERVSPAFVDTFASFRASVREGDITIPRVPMGEPLKTECDHFLECIQFGKEPLTDGRLGVSVVKALEAIRRSMDKGGREEQL